MLRVHSCCAEAMRKALGRGMLLVAVCLLCSLHGGHANLQRTAQLVHGELVTSREMLLAGQGAEARRLVESPEPSVWVLGLHPTQERQVQVTLASVNGKVLHPLPGKDSHHLVVQADENAIRHVLEQHEEATAAVLHHTMKVSPGVQMHVQHLQHEGGQPHMTLLVLLPRASDEARDAVVHAAQLQLPSELAHTTSSCHLHVEQDGFFLQITVCLEGAEPAALWAAQQLGVTWVDVAPITKAGNLYANAITQSATKLHDEMDGGPSSPPPLDVLQGVSSGMFPLWQAGLDGTGQIAAVIDTGIDADSCFFWDPAYDFNASTTVKTLPNVGNKTQVASFPNHRKLVELIAYQGSIDQYGHGTHTSCTVLGSAPGFNISQPPLLGTGIAPGAKLVAVDGGPDNLPTEDVLTPFHPANLYTHIKGVGAYVTSNSWGSNMFYYGAYCVSWDDFARSAPDMLHVFSAGNNAVVDRHLTRTNGTVGSPGFCKNVLTVGATESWVPDGWQYDHSTWLPFNLTANGQPVDVSAVVSNYTLPPRFLATVPGTLTFEVLPSQPAARRLQQGSGNQTFVLDSNKLEWFNQPGFLSTFSSTIPNTLNLVLADPPNGCSITGNVSNTDVLLVRKTAADLNATNNDTSPAGCTPLKVAMLAKQAGAAGVLMYWDGVNYTALPDTANFTFPAGLISKPGVGQQLAQLLAGGSTVTVTYQLGQSAPRPDDVLPFENVAEFSSFNGVANGTGQDSRFKPDIMAPGFLISAYSNRRTDEVEDQCTVVPSAGTSMATPVVAGSAILARQYFMQGFYPSGQPNATDAFTPSGPLLKAVLIAGTAAMQGYSIADGQRLPPPPSPTQGFGRLNLSASLPLATTNSTTNATNSSASSNSTAAWRMHAIDNIQLLANGTSYTYQVQVLDGGAPAPLVVTVVWHDIPGYPGSTRVLVNDLDLTVQDPSGTTYWGNNVTNGDRVNNVEKVYIPAAAPGVYQVTINTVYIFDDAQAGAQNFSLVLLGNIPPGPSASQTRSTPAPAPGGGNIVLNPNYTSPSPSWWLPSPSPTGGAATSLHFKSILAALGHRVLLACMLVAIAALSQLAH